MTQRPGDDIAQWQVVEVTGIGDGELWFETVADGLSERPAQLRANKDQRYIAIPEPQTMPDDWGEQFLAGELEDDPFA